MLTLRVSEHGSSNLPNPIIRPGSLIWGSVPLKMERLWVQVPPRTFEGKKMIEKLIGWWFRHDGGVFTPPTRSKDAPRIAKCPPPKYD